MKMKKLLSIGALGLVLACSTSVGASAAETMPSKTQMLLNIAIQQYNTGQNETGLLSGVKKDTKIGTVVDEKLIEKADLALGEYKTVDKAITKFENNKDNTVSEVLSKAVKDEATFKKFRDNFVRVAKEIKEMDKITDPVKRAEKEKLVMDLVKAYDSRLTVAFGKNAKGETTGTIYKNYRILVQLDYSDIDTIITEVSKLTWNDVALVKALVTK